MSSLRTRLPRPGPQHMLNLERAFPQQPLRGQHTPLGSRLLLRSAGPSVPPAPLRPSAAPHTCDHLALADHPQGTRWSFPRPDIHPPGPLRQAGVTSYGLCTPPAFGVDESPPGAPGAQARGSGFSTCGLPAQLRLCPLSKAFLTCGPRGSNVPTTRTGPQGSSSSS